MNEAMNCWHLIFDVDLMNDTLSRWRWFVIDLKIEKMKWMRVKVLNQNIHHRRCSSVVVVLVLDVLEIALLEIDYD